MFKLSDRVKETTLTQGTGTLTLAGSFGSFQSFLDGIGEGNSTFYTIENNNQFEIGIGTFSSNTLSRDTILSSNNSNNKINLAGMSLVFCTYPASKSVFLEDGFIKSLSPQYSGIIFPDQTFLTSANGITGGSGNIELPTGLVYTNDSRLSDDRYPLYHIHNIVDVSGLQSSLDSKQPSGNYASSSHSHIISDVSGLQLALDEKQPSGNYAASSHTHTSSSITDFNSSVSGLLPVKDITAGYDISITNTSGTYSIASTNLVHIDGKQPHGFVNRTDSVISLSGNIFTIAPTGASYAIYNNGLKIIKTAPESITIPSGITQINYIHFNSDTTAIDNKTTGFDFTTDLPIAFISWNGSISPSGQMTFFAEERHGINMDARTQQWIHNTFGAQYINGLSIGNYVLGGNGSSNTHATFAISNGTIYQEDIQIDITDTTDVNLPFGQELNPIAQIPIYYHEGNTGQWVKSIPNDYAMAYGANGPKYNLLTGSTWTVENVHSGSQTRYFAVWILATNQLDNPIISILGQRVDNTLNAAENNNSWSDVNLTNLPLNEVQILYRLIYAGDADYTNTPKAKLMSILDLRTASIVNTVGTPQNDHGSLFGLGDDDHGQYVHIDNARTISAIHTLTNGITFDGSGTQTVPYIPNQVNITGGSGDFSSLKLNSTTVSVSGHSHTSSDISDFNSSVSGILPVKNILSGTNVTISSSSGNYTVNSTQILNYATTASFPTTGSTNTYYLSSDTGRFYQWTGSYYAEIGPPISSINNAQNAANLYMWSNFK
jgi:hypothetical protein